MTMRLAPVVPGTVPAMGKPWEGKDSKDSGGEGSGMKRCPACNWRNAKGETSCSKCKATLAKKGDAKLKEGALAAVAELTARGALSSPPGLE